MSNILFTKDDIKILKDNQWVKNVTEKAITYKDEFKIHFINGLNLYSYANNNPVGIAYSSSSVGLDSCWNICSWFRIKFAY